MGAWSCPPVLNSKGDGPLFTCEEANYEDDWYTYENCVLTEDFKEFKKGHKFEHIHVNGEQELKIFDEEGETILFVKLVFAVEPDTFNNKDW